MKLLLSSLAASGLAICSAHAQITIGLDFAGQNDDGGGAVLDSTNATFSTTDIGTSTAIGFVQDGFADSFETVVLTDGDLSGTYEISVDVTSISASIARGGTGTLGTFSGTGNNLLDAGESLTFDNVTLTFVSGNDAFRFEGFTGVRVGNLSGGETGAITDRAGNTLLSLADMDPGEGGGNDFGPTAPFALTSSVVYSGAGTSLNVLDAQFGLIPAQPFATLSVAAEPVIETFSIDVVFSEDVSGLDATDFVVTNGTVDGVLPASGPASTYSVTVTPASSGTVELSLPAGAAQDSANSDSLASETLFVSAVLEPMVEISTSASEPVAGAFTIDVVYNKDVTGLDVADFAVINGAASDVSPAEGPASTYTVLITPEISADVEVSLPAAAAQDENGLDSFASNAFSIFAVLPPAVQATATLSTTVVGQVFGGTYVVDVTFSEDVVGLDAADFMVVNGLVTDVTPAEGPASVYAVTIDPLITGDVEVTLQGAGVLDFNDSLRTADSNTLVTDFFNPSIPVATFDNFDEIDGVITDPDFLLSVTFSEEVVGLEASDFIVTNGVITSFEPFDTTEFDIEITASSTGAIIVELPAGSATDVDGENQGNAPGLSITNFLADDVFVTPLINLAGRDDPELGRGRIRRHLRKP